MFLLQSVNCLPVTQVWWCFNCLPVTWVWWCFNYLTTYLWLRYDGALTANLRLRYDGALTAYLWLRYDSAVVRAGPQLGVLPGGEDHGAQVVVGVLCCAVIGRDGGCRLVQRHEHCIHGDDLVPGHKHAGCHWAEGVTDQLQLDGASTIDQDIKPGGGGDTEL